MVDTIDLISNIQTSMVEGLQYAYEQEGKFNTLVTAECVEYGELFEMEFYVPSNYTKQECINIGNELAMCYGGSCYNVKINKN